MNIPTSAINAWKSLFRKGEVRQLQGHEDKILFLLTLMIGAAVGLVIVAFIVLTENLGSKMYPAGDAAWRRVLVPVAGSLLTGFLLVRYFRDARGSGIPQTKMALVLHSGVITLRTVIGKFLCSTITLASGIALGREGPSVQIGAGLASVLGRQFGLSPEKTKALVPIGAAAALAAAFNTPIAAVLFTLEEVMGNMHARVLGAIVMSSATSWMVLHLLLGDEPLFHVPAYQLVHPGEFLLYAALGALGGLVSAGFVKTILRLRSCFLRMPAWSVMFQPAAGGLLVGILGWMVPAVLGVGYSNVSEALNSKMALGTMALLVVLKFIATAGCYSSGNSGGIFGPSLFIGAMMGGAFGAGAHTFLPDYTGSVGAYALVGMGVAFAGIVRAPMTSVIMIFEITRDYSIIVPLMIANLSSYFISSRLQKKPVYEALMHQDGVHLPTVPRERKTTPSVLRGMRPPDAVLQAGDRIGDVLSRLSSEAAAWPVVREGQLLGMATRERLQREADDGRGGRTMAELFPAQDSANAPTIDDMPHLHPDQPVDVALRRLAQSGLPALPVVSRTDPGKLIATFGVGDAMAAYKGDRKEAPMTAAPAAIGRIAGVITLMIGLSGFLSWFYRSQREDRAQDHAATGSSLMAAGRYPEAVEQFRSALSISHKFQDRLALASALATARRWNEAEIYFRELERENPQSGPVSLGLGRIAAEKGKVSEAVRLYRKAAYADWPADASVDGLAIRMELIAFLGRAEQPARARAELLALAADCPENSAARMRVARLLLDHKLPSEAAGIYRGVLSERPGDAAVHAGLGQAEFELRNFASARQAFQQALFHNPGDARGEARLKLIDRILELDAEARGLKAVEKYERSRNLLEAVCRSLDTCFVRESKGVPESVRTAMETARRSLEHRGRPRSYGNAAENHLELAAGLWQERMRYCGTPPADDAALAIVMEPMMER